MAILAVSNVTREPSQVPLVPTRPSPIRVAVADDSFLIREALTEVLERHGGVDLVASFADGDSLLAAIDASHRTSSSSTSGCRRRATTRDPRRPAPAREPSRSSASSS